MGPIVELMSLANAVQKRGHEVAFAAKELFIQQVRGQGYNMVYPVPSRDNPPIDEFFLKDFPVFQGLGDKAYVESILAHEQNAVDGFEPDAIVSILQFTASITARANGVKHVSIARWTEHPSFSSPIFEELFGTPLAPPSNATSVFNQILRGHRLPEVRDVWDLSFLYSGLKIAPSPQELEPGLADVPNLHYVGFLKGIEIGSRTEVPQWLYEWASLPSTKVFVYLSAKELTPDVYAPVLAQAFSGMDVRAIVALGPQVKKELNQDDTDEVRFVEWVPGEYVISSSDVVVSTGTRTTTLQAILAGTGSVLFPGRDDELDFISFRSLTIFQ